jgi:hypothetical protein
MNKFKLLGAVALCIVALVYLERLKSESPRAYLDAVPLGKHVDAFTKIKAQNAELIKTVLDLKKKMSIVNQITPPNYAKDSLIFFIADTTSDILQLQSFFANEVGGDIVLRPRTAFGVESQPRKGAGKGGVFQKQGGVVRFTLAANDVRN